ncbi:class I SAM-dependent methyltransferase [Actinoplanes auranticolor]|uniref:Methyltransferase n=1 Tax=Actinoplanes auranticolor TaxID=47988 RepID=A0A919SF52_9ACTN|nr:class I SAM-dependent methyltransferase [Actinoplanes auranticolor]GIM71272.1 putative methyltransferase [Actinoplanes auranticolor]
MSDETAAASFGLAAAVYERGRPPYPAEALDWLLPAGAGQVVDLGAGTGKLTRQIRDRGLHVTAVEPSDGMRAELGRVLPDVPALAGSAEAIPLSDHSADAVLCAQAWHWVDPERAVPEAARVLRPGGRLGLIWNLRDEREDWVRRLGELIHSPEQHRRAEFGPPFGTVEIRDFTWTHEITLDRLLDLVASRSYIILLSERERAAVLEAVRELTATHPALAGHDTFPLPYVTECARADLPQS